MTKKSILTPPRIAVLAAVLIGAGVTLFVSGAVQQNYRQSADDPQIQLAEDAAAALTSGRSPQDVIGSTQIDMRDSLAPFVMVISSSGQTLSTSGRLSGITIQPPPGTLYNDHRFTWQPRSDTRLAAVVEQYHGGYVVAARNLREVENRELDLRTMGLVTLLGIAVVAGAAFAILAP